MISIKCMALLLLLLLSVFASPAIADPLHHICGTSAGNFTSNSTYSTYLSLLLSTLSNQTSATGFANSTAGTIFGLAFCRADTNNQTCRSCISTAISDIQQLCPNNKDASIWYDHCQLRYGPNSSSNSSNYLLVDPNNVSADQLSRFEIQTTALMRSVSDLALNTWRFFATGEIALTGADIIYGLMQCALDLTVRNCRTCLNGMMDTISRDPRKGARGRRALGNWCVMRYETYKFYDGTSMRQLSQPPPPSSQPLPPQSPPFLPSPSPSSTNVSTPNATYGPTDSSHGGKKTLIKRVAIFSSVGILLLLITIFCLIRMRKRRDKGISKPQKDQAPLTRGTDIASKHKIKESNLEFSQIKFSSIVEATGNFSTANKLGQGGFGSVYKGQLPEGESIAVKRLDAFSGQGQEEFMNEIRLIAKLQHRNLVKLLGCCVERDEKLLVYEYMPNNSLDYHLFDPVRNEQLDWSKRFTIIDGIAQGLLYLHKYSRLRIIHRDLKASNILLDLEMNPKISDFGMARIFDANTTQANTNRIVGTYGYMSPEYAMEGLFSIKSDVFSFGVLILEIISGKRNTTFHKSGKALNLLAYVWELWKNGNWLDFVDPSLGDKILTNEVSKCIIMALMCVQENAIDRPVMSEIITMLGRENTILPEPKKPAFYTIGNQGASELLIYEPSSQNDITITDLDGR